MLTNINSLFFPALFLMPVSSAVIAAPAQINDGWHSAQRIFTQHDKTATNAYRIPAIAATKSTIIVVTDARANGTSDIGLNKEVHFSYRVSPDAGNNWSMEKEIIPDIKGKRQISDPAIVYNKDSGSTFLFGFYNDKFIVRKPPSENSDFFMFKSDDGGKTWNKGDSLYYLAPKGYKYILQGPGSGMYYNGTIYVAVQAWHNSKDASLLGGTTATSGFIYSADNGKTWGSAWLRPEDKITGKPGTDGLPDISSEGSVFHHDGYIYLSVKPETSRTAKHRILYRTKDHGKSWQSVTEDFLPDNISRAESSSLSLDDKVYLVGYTTRTKRAGRDGIYITTNTGRRIHVFDAPVNGYTSMAQDADNLYIFFEGQGDMYFKRYDISSKDYANLNAITLQRGHDVLYIQDKLTGNKSYIKGAYGKNDSVGSELFYENNGIKMGLFYARQSDNSKHAERTISYATKNLTLALAKENLVLPQDTASFGYQFSRINYLNKSANDVDSWFLGYSLSHKFTYLDYNLYFNGIYSHNDFSRNNAEGLGRKAEFDTYSVSIKNALAKAFNLRQDIYGNIESGLQTTFFNHGKFTEQGGNLWNNVTLDSSNNWSNQLFVNAQISKAFTISQTSSLILTAKASYQYELMNSDLWAEHYTVLDSQRTMSPPVRKYNNGLASGFLEVKFDINKYLTVAAAASLDTAGDSMAKGAITYYF